MHEAIAQTIENDPGLRRKRDLLLSISGVGETLAGVVLAELPGPDVLHSSSRISGQWQDDDFDVFDGEHEVGRIFQQADGAWFWGVSFRLTGRKSYGHAPSL